MYRSGCTSPKTSHQSRTRSKLVAADSSVLSSVSALRNLSTSIERKDQSAWIGNRSPKSKCIPRRKCRSYGTPWLLPSCPLTKVELPPKSSRLVAPRWACRGPPSGLQNALSPCCASPAGSFSLVTWNARALSHRTASKRRKKFSVLRGLARHATCIVLQETHGAAQEVKLRHASSFSIILLVRTVRLAAPLF